MATISSSLYKRPSIGELNRRIIIRRRVDFPTGNMNVDNALQGLASSYSESFERWAAIIPIGTSIYMDSVQIDNGLSTITHRIKLRFISHIDTSYEVVHKTTVYRVKRVVNQMGEGRFTVLECEEINSE